VLFFATDLRPTAPRRTRCWSAACLTNLREWRPDNVRYCSLKLGDGVSSVHIMEAAEGHPLADLSALSRRLWRKLATGASSTPIDEYRLFEV
jgi:hypothetical protein